MDDSAADELVRRVLELKSDRLDPLMVALDGQSGAGKSTLAAVVATLTGAAVIDGDDFYAGGTAEQWDAMTPRQRADHCIDWRRQRPILEALAERQVVSWQPYDWDADDGGLSTHQVTCHPADVVILEGVYSARPELADLFDLRVLLETPKPVRRERLRQREGGDRSTEIEARWASAEEYYFEVVRPLPVFDMVITDTSS